MLDHQVHETAQHPLHRNEGETAEEPGHVDRERLAAAARNGFPQAVRGEAGQREEDLQLGAAPLQADPLQDEALLS